VRATAQGGAPGTRQTPRLETASSAEMGVRFPLWSDLGGGTASLAEFVLIFVSQNMYFDASSGPSECLHYNVLIVLFSKRKCNFSDEPKVDEKF